jgi:alkylation response protein AidB-like acyl-CoA dehydrogenase
MSRALNWYKADLRDFHFLIFEQFRLQDLLGKAPFQDWGKDDVAMVLKEVYEWSCDVLGPLNGTADAVGCTLEDGKVTAPPGFREAWRSLYEAGWRGLAAPDEFGGQDGPFTLHTLAEELMSGACTAFNMYPALTQGVADLIGELGTAEQRASYCQKLYDGTFAGTMCLTESHAGSDVGMSSTRATPIGDGRYRLEGTKIYISGGDHDLSDNIIHLVLARTEDAPSGTRGLSLFIVPRDRLDGTGSNDVSVGSIEHKMGINGSATCVLNFGDKGGCIGELVGSQEQQGMRQMFRLMNYARIAVGIQGLSVASSAYLNALEFARERKQGTSVASWKDPDAPRVPIIEHPDVRRMLMDMKARVEGIRALTVKLTVHLDRARAVRDSDPGAAGYHLGQVDLLVPLLKAYASDQAFAVCATAIQVHGGAGYLHDHPVEQYCRDAKIFSIYEGTNHIQALDLVGRKLGQKGGANLQAFFKDVGSFVAEHREHAELGAAVTTLAAAVEAVQGTAMRFLGWSTSGAFDLVALSANRFLEMMAETTVGWLLLHGALVAGQAAASLTDDHPDRAFYQGRVHSALYYARNVLPDVAHKAALVAAADRSALDLSDAAFARL